MSNVKKKANIYNIIKILLNTIDLTSPFSPANIRRRHILSVVWHVHIVNCALDKRQQKRSPNKASRHIYSVAAPRRLSICNP